MQLRSFVMLVAKALVIEEVSTNALLMIVIAITDSS